MDCLNHIKTETENSPEEFICMCGIVGYAVRNKNNNELVIETIRKYASNKSWRIREAVAMRIQEISEENMQATCYCSCSN